MKPTHVFLLAIAGAFLGGCSGGSGTEDVAGGGFETSDLTAIVVDPAGTVVVGARAWLVQESADSLDPMAALDSLLVGPAGGARFPGARARGRGLGVEAWSGDTLYGFAAVPDSGAADTVHVVLRRTRALFLPCSSLSGNHFVMQGTHFVQQAPSACMDSFRLLVPPGPWRMTALPMDSTLPPRPLAGQGDSLPPWTSYFPGGTNNPWQPLPPLPPVPSVPGAGGAGAGAGAGAMLDSAQLMMQKGQQPVLPG